MTRTPPSGRGGTRDRRQPAGPPARPAVTGAERFVALRRAVISDDRLSAAQRRATLTDLADAWLTRFFVRVPAAARQGCAVVAIGGYGRRELLPGSDLDVLLLHGEEGDPAAVAERVFYPVWDAGLELDHSVRTLKEALEVAGGDLKVALGLIDARHVAGDSDLTDLLRGEVRADWRRQAGDRLPGLAAMCRERADRVGELGHLLEPDLVQAYGGLRDCVALRAVAASWVADRPHTAAVESARQWLLTVRDAVHRVAGRRYDRLLFEDQAAVAARLTLPDPDTLLRRVAEAGRVVAHASDVTWREVERTLAARRPGRRRVVRYPLADGVVDHDGEAALARGARPERDPVLPLRAAAAAAQAGLLLGPGTIHRLATECPPLPEPWPDSARDALVSLLGAGHRVVPVWELLEAAGLVVRWFPEWKRIRYLATRTPVHRHTVDRHLVETAAVAAGLTRQVSRPDLLLLAALFHDLGKGVAGEHSKTGEPIARNLGHRLGLGADDAETLGRLVRHHLLLPETAVRRDPDDPATLATVVDAVGTPDFLELLAALTEADATAAGPLAWSPMRARLVGGLVARVREVLDGTSPPEPGRLEPWQAELARSGELAVRLDSLDRPGGPDGLKGLDGPDGLKGLDGLDGVDGRDGIDSLDGLAGLEGIAGRRVTVVVPGSVQALGAVAGVLALHRLDVRAASAHPVDDATVLVWRVGYRHGNPPDEARLRTEIGRALEGHLDLAGLLEARAAQRRGRVIAHAQSRVNVLPAVSASATVLEVRAHDEPGLLYRLATAIAGTGAMIRSAVLETLGSEAVDAFYLVDAEGAALSRKDVARVVSATRAALP